MRQDRQAALKLRLRGKSYNEIKSELNIPKSTLSGWFAKLVLPNAAKKKIHKGFLDGLLARNKLQTVLAIKRSLLTRNQAKGEMPCFSRKELKFMGLILYWAEGYKRPLMRGGRILTSHPVALTNSDPILIKLFLKFLREIYKVPNEKIKADIRIFEHMNAEQLTKFWVNIAGLPERNFGKIYYGVSKSSLHKRPFNRLPYGTLMIRVSDTSLYYKIMGGIDGISKYI